MNRLTMLALLLPAVACGGSPAPVPAPSQVPPPQTVPPQAPRVASVREITVGERVDDVFGDGLMINPGEHQFFLTAPSGGTLEASLSWNPLELGTLLMLKMEDRAFPPSRPGWSPVVGQLPVQAGKRYLIVVALAGADWLPKDPFVLTTRLTP